MALSIGGLILGVINIAIVVALLLLFGLLVVWLIKVFEGQPFDPQIRKFYLIFVMLIAIYMLVALVLGLPSMHVLPFR